MMLTNYSYEYCPTESSAGSTLSYIGIHLLLNQEMTFVSIKLIN